MSVEHYENFPVASWLMPRHLRPAVQAIYAFARSADDIADEGDIDDETRLTALSYYEAQLQQIENKQESQDPLFQKLAIVLAEYELPFAPLFKLLSAFKQDVICKRYQTFTELQDYCSRSADPVGCLMLHLYDANTPENLLQSNQICTALQLINFWQDIAIDWQKERVYLPLEDLRRFHVKEEQIGKGQVDQQWKELMQFQIDRARSMMLAGSPLCKKLPGRIGFELRLVVQGGLRILEKIEYVQMNIFSQRPQITSLDSPLLLWRALTM